MRRPERLQCISLFNFDFATGTADRVLIRHALRSNLRYFASLVECDGAGEDLRIVGLLLTPMDLAAAHRCVARGDDLYKTHDFAGATVISSPAPRGRVRPPVAPKVHRDRAQSPLAAPERGRRAGTAKNGPKTAFSGTGARRALLIVRAGRHFWKIASEARFSARRPSGGPPRGRGRRRIRGEAPPSPSAPGTSCRVLRGTK